MDRLIFPDGLGPDRFLEHYWQKRPLLMRQALPGFRAVLQPDELAGLACEHDVESRLVLEKDGARPWEARQGPFTADDFADLPDSHWTLLVQDADKHEPEVARLLTYFRFVPDWRVDDVMISYAPDQGSVGPHIDDYDVFLVQAHGRRRWRIDTRAIADDEFIPGLDLRILPRFETTHDWLLEPGDILYLPPNLAHWGVAEGDCMTYSVGFRAPLLRDMAQAWMETRIGQRIPAARYRDPGLRRQPHSGEIDSGVFERFEAMIGQLQDADSAEMRAWLGRYLTEPKDNLHAFVPESPLSMAQFLEQWRQHGDLLRSGYARMAFRLDDAAGDQLFVNGLVYPLDTRYREFLILLSDQRRLSHARMAPWLGDALCRNLLLDFYNQGYVEFPDE